MKKKEQKTETSVQQISQMKEGSEAQIVELKGTVQSRRRLTSLGLVPGERIRVIRPGSPLCPLVVSRAGCDIVMERRLADIVWVDSES